MLITSLFERKMPFKLISRDFSCVYCSETSSFNQPQNLVVKWLLKDFKMYRDYTICQLKILFYQLTIDNWLLGCRVGNCRDKLRN